MSRSGRLCSVVFAFVLVLLTGACAGTANREFVRELDPLVGRADQPYFLQKYGDPDKRIAVDATTDVWEYTFGQQPLSDYVGHTTMTTYTLVRLTFKNGTLSRWQA